MKRKNESLDQRPTKRAKIDDKRKRERGPYIGGFKDEPLPKIDERRTRPLRPVQCVAANPPSLSLPEEEPQQDRFNAFRYIERKAEEGEMVLKRYRAYLEMNNMIMEGDYENLF